MPSATASPVTLLSQQCSADVLPARGGGTTEASRLRAARCWNYALRLQLGEPAADFSLLLSRASVPAANDQVPALMAIEAQLGETEDMWRLQLRRVAGSCRMQDLDWLPAHAEVRQIEVPCADPDPDLRCLQFAKPPPPAVFEVRLRALDALRVPALLAQIGATQLNLSDRFAEPARVAIERHDDFRIDRLVDAQGRVQSMAAHLHDMLQAVLVDVDECTLAIECAYEVALSAAVTSRLPVLLSQPQAYSQKRSKAIGKRVAMSLLRWHLDQRPVAGEFVIGLGIDIEPVPGKDFALHLRQLRLPVAAISDLW
jgi:hypothetical protein